MPSHHSSLPFTFFFFTATATTEIYTLSLHDALPICVLAQAAAGWGGRRRHGAGGHQGVRADRKSTRLNSSHRCISYAVFCLKKKNLDRRSARVRGEQTHRCRSALAAITNRGQRHRRR